MMRAPVQARKGGVALRFLFALVVVLSALALSACGAEEEAELTATTSTPATAESPTLAAATSTPAPTVVRTATPKATPTTAPPADPAASDLVEGNLTTALPAGEPGKVSILAVGPLERSGTVAVIARNNTPDSIIQVHLTGTARGPDGALLASGKDQGMKPTIVRSGEVVFGFIYFSYDAQFPDGTQYEISATWDKGESDDYFLGLQITEINQLEDRIVGMLTNPHSQEVSGPIGVDVICFDEAGQPISTPQTFAAQDSIPAGGTASFQVDLYGNPCPQFLLAASGYAL